MYPLLAHEDAINEALNVNQSYRWSSKNFTPQIGLARISSMHNNNCVANPSSEGDDLHKSREIIER